MQCACAILPAVACPALQYFATLSHKRYDFRKKKKTLNTKSEFLFSVQLLSEIFSHYKKTLVRYDHKSLIGLLVKYRLLTVC